MKYIKYVTKQGDRWDTIAHKAYGIASKFKGIMEANRTVSRAPVLEAGIELLIPIIEESVIKGGKDVPPWKETDVIDNGFGESQNVEIVEESRINENVSARFQMVNTRGNVVGSGSVTAGTIGQVTSPDAYVSFNGGEPVAVATGETHDVEAPIVRIEVNGVDKGIIEGDPFKLKLKNTDIPSTAENLPTFTYASISTNEAHIVLTNNTIVPTNGSGSIVSFATKGCPISVYSNDGANMKTVFESSSFTPGSSGVITIKPDTNYNVLKTGATGGFEGATPMGYSDDLLTLDFKNYFGTYERFTAIDGTQNYSTKGNIVLDWSTFRCNDQANASVLAYYLIPFGDGVLTDLSTINDEIEAFSETFNGKTYDGWRMANIRQLNNLLDFNKDPYSDGLFLDLFELDSKDVCSSTEVKNSGNDYYGYNNYNMPYVHFAGDTYMYAMAVKYLNPFTEF